ncbi:MAG: tetratricopeptide repeat protein, partial [Bacteroidales bacterium]|nr:tetratricopeptide repeat protein [Bacteroidales bacterium]
IFYYRLSLSNYQKTNLHNEIAGVANDLGQAFHLKSQLDTSRFYLNLALDHIDKEELPEGYFSIMINLATNWFYEGKIAKSNEQYFKILEEGKSFLPPDKIAVVYNNLGLNYKRVANYEKSTYYYKKALVIDDSLGLYEEMITDYANLGNSFYQWKRFDAALNAFNETLKIADSQKLESKKTNIYNDLSGVYRALNQFDTSIYLLELSLSLAEKYNNTYMIAIANHGLGMTYFQMGQFSKAKPFTVKALKMFKEMGQIFSQGNALLVLGRINQALKLDNEAISNYQQADSVAVMMSAIELQKDIAYQLANFYSARHDYKQSDYYYKRFVMLNDSVFNNRSHELLTEFEVKLDVLQKEREVERVNAVNEIQLQRIGFQSRVLWILALSSLIFLALGITIYFLFRAKSQSYRLLFEKNKQMLEEAKTTAKQRIESSKSGVSDSFSEEMAGKILHLMKDEKLFLDEEFTASKLAEKLNTNTTYLSQIINDQFNTNFNGFVNKYRIDLAQEKLLHPDYSNFTIEAIANECGFKSKSSFNQAFKKYTGLTPSYYQEQGRR